MLLAAVCLVVVCCLLFAASCFLIWLLTVDCDLLFAVCWSCSFAACCLLRDVCPLVCCCLLLVVRFSLCGVGCLLCVFFGVC